MDKKIEETLVHYQTLEAFKRDLAEYGTQMFENKIVFIKDEQMIWTHDRYYNDGPKHVFITQRDYNRLKRYDNNTIYFVLGPRDYWTFGQRIPATFK